MSSFLSLTEHKSDICKKERTMPQVLLGRRALSWAYVLRKTGQGAAFTHVLGVPTTWIKHNNMHKGLYFFLLIIHTSEEQ